MARRIAIGPGCWEIVLPRGRVEVLFVDKNAGRVRIPEFINSAPALMLDVETEFDIIIRGRAGHPVPVLGLELQMIE